MPDDLPPKEPWALAPSAHQADLPEGLEAALVYLEGELTAYGYEPLRVPYDLAGQTVYNLEAERIGDTAPEEIIVVGAHYDGFYDVPAANDNGSGVAATLALAKRMSKLASPVPTARTVRFVFFVNEEPPHFQRPTMGSLVYAKDCAERDDDIRAMWSLETLGYYSDEEGSQSYPVKMLEAAYPSRGNFVAFVGSLTSSRLVRKTVKLFREAVDFPSEGASLPGFIAGVGWSDHWSFAEVGYRALMVTDTAVFRDPHYHTAEDLPERLDVDRMARVVDGLHAVLTGFIDGTTEL